MYNIVESLDIIMYYIKLYYNLQIFF